MQNNSKRIQNNAIKLASFSALLLAGICIFPQEEIPATKTNEATITVSDEVFKVQSNNSIIENDEASFVVENQEVDFDETQNKELTSKISKKIAKEILVQLLVN